MTGSILVTGGNRGIGLEFVRQYLTAGWRVFAGCRNPENAIELNRLAAGAAGALSVHPLDVVNPRQVQAAAAALGSAPLDLLVNNAGVYGPEDSAFGTLDPDAWLEVFRVNTIAPVKLTEAFITNLTRSKRGVVAALSSKMGSIADNGSGGSYIYRSSKSALNAAMKSAAIDLAPQGVTVVVLHPGWVKTDMGGPDAQIDVDQSVRCMRRILDSVTAADSGRFIDIDGSSIPW